MYECIGLYNYIYRVAYIQIMLEAALFHRKNDSQQRRSI